MLDILVPEVVLNDAGIVSIIGEFESRGVSQHMGMGADLRLKDF
jgi:hypothetical protein